MGGGGISFLKVERDITRRSSLHPMNAIQESIAPMEQTSGMTAPMDSATYRLHGSAGTIGREPRMEFQMRNKTFTSSMVGVAAAVAVAGSANAGVVDNFATALNGVGVTNGTVTLTDTAPGAGKAANQDNLTGTVFPVRDMSIANRGSSATITGNGSGSFTLGQATGTGSGQSNNNSWGLMSLSYGNGFDPHDLTGTTSFSINVGSYAGAATTWRLSVFMDSQGAGDRLDLTLSNSDITNGVLTFHVASMADANNVDWSNVDRIDLFVMRTSYGPANSTASFSLSNFQYNVVPAPGALALLGVAGIVGARRRA